MDYTEEETVYGKDWVKKIKEENVPTEYERDYEYRVSLVARIKKLSDGIKEGIPQAPVFFKQAEKNLKTLKKNEKDIIRNCSKRAWNHWERRRFEYYEKKIAMKATKEKLNQHEAMMDQKYPEMKIDHEWTTPYLPATYNVEDLVKEAKAIGSVQHFYAFDE